MMAVFLDSNEIHWPYTWYATTWNPTMCCSYYDDMCSRYLVAMYDLKRRQSFVQSQKSEIKHFWHTLFEIVIFSSAPAWSCLNCWKLVQDGENFQTFSKVIWNGTTMSAGVSEVCCIVLVGPSTQHWLLDYSGTNFCIEDTDKDNW